MATPRRCTAGSPKTFATSADAFQILQNLIGGELGGG